MNLDFQGCHISHNLEYWELNGNPDKKVTPDSSYLWLKTSKNEICFSGFPKKAYQGSLISEGAIENLTKIIFSLTPYSYYSAHANAVSGNSMCYIQMGCASG